MAFNKQDYVHCKSINRDGYIVYIPEPGLYTIIYFVNKNVCCDDFLENDLVIVDNKA